MSATTYLPCDVCQTPIDADIHAEELGMCLECSDAYYEHNYEVLESRRRENNER